MDLQAIVNTMNEQTSDTRAGYHLTYGQLVDILKTAPKTAKLDKRVLGIGSWRGSYIEIALYTNDTGLYCQDGEYTGAYKDIEDWEKTHAIEVEELPTNANELGTLLESIIGKDFIGYKGGNFTISRNKPLWLEEDDSTSNGVAILGLDKDLTLITKEIN